MRGLTCLYESQYKEVMLVPLSRTPAQYIWSQFIHTPQRFRGIFFPLTQLFLKFYFCWLHFVSPTIRWDLFLLGKFTKILLLISLLILSKNSFSTSKGSFTCFWVRRCSKNWRSVVQFNHITVRCQKSCSTPPFLS